MTAKVTTAIALARLVEDARMQHGLKDIIRSNESILESVGVWFG